MKAIPEAGMPRLLFFVQHRLVQLQWTRKSLAAAGGPNPSTLRKAHREDRELAERTLARLDRALGWQPGSAQRVLDGGSPAVRISEQVETVTSNIDAALRDEEEAGVRHTAAELRDFLMTVAQQLDGFYTRAAQVPGEVADVGAC
jgi:hypothetical protein